MAMTATGRSRRFAPVTVAQGESFRESLSRGRLILVLVGLMLGMLLAALDQTIVGTAMPRIIADLNGLNHYAWVATSYLLASTVMVPIYGKLSDIYGRRPFFIGGMLIFLLGSALSGASHSMTQLIFFRGIQGLGAGALMPLVQAIVGDIFPPAQRGKWQGLFMSVFGLATIVGPTGGGWITDNWGWRWVFYVNMPIGAIALAVASFAIPGLVRRRQHQVDYLGAMALVAATVPLLLAFSWAGTTYPWKSGQVIGLLIFAVAMTVAFIVIERKSTEPIISPSFFKNSIFTVSVIATFLVSVGMFGAIMFLPLFVQGVLGNSATSSGAVTTPMMFGFMFSSIVGGQLLSRTGRYKLMALVAFAIAAFGAYLLSGMGVATSNGIVVRNMIVLGLGIGVTMSLFTIVVQNAFPFSQLGQVTASLQFFRSIGGTIGIAVLGSVLTNRFQGALQSNMPAAIKQAVPADKLAAFQNPQVLLAPGVTEQLQHQFASLGPQGQQLFQQLMLAIRTSLASAIVSLFLVSMGAMILAFISTLFLREIPLRKGFHPTATPASAPQRPSRARMLLGITFALVAREAQRPDADPVLLKQLSRVGDGRLPQDWSVDQRGRVVARDVIEPLAVHLLASATGDGAQVRSTARTEPEGQEPALGRAGARAVVAPAPAAQAAG